MYGCGVRKITALGLSAVCALVFSGSAQAQEPAIASHNAKTSCDVAVLAANALAEVSADSVFLPSPADLANR
jgi:hypothetical protein